MLSKASTSKTSKSYPKKAANAPSNLGPPPPAHGPPPPPYHYYGSPPPPYGQSGDKNSMPPYHGPPPPSSHGMGGSSPGSNNPSSNSPPRANGYPTDASGAPPNWQGPHPHGPPPPYYMDGQYHRDHYHHWSGPPAPFGPPPPPPPPVDNRPPPNRPMPPHPYWGTRGPPGQPEQPRPPTTPTSNQSRKSGKNKNDVDGRAGATSPSQIESTHRDEVQHMGCTCKKTRCLKLYCQCFGVKLFCGGNCRCFQCFNSRKHEKARKEAMRAILSRNPHAFDTKYKKTVDASGKIVTTPAATSSPAETARVLTHKTGCKCRKSACMKKYCECYAGNVKCSPSCRCMGCKNMAVPGFYDRDENAPAGPLQPKSQPPMPYAYHMPPHMIQHPPPPTGRGANGEPWVAAQNLTFLKHGSPSSSEKKRKKDSEPPEIASMPSLASSSNDTSPGIGDSKTKEDGERDDEEGVSSLLMAAYAMTEFGAKEEESGKRPKRSSKEASGSEGKPSPKKV